MLVAVALLFPVLLLFAVLGMERVEDRLDTSRAENDPPVEITLDTPAPESTP